MNLARMHLTKSNTSKFQDPSPDQLHLEKHAQRVFYPSLVVSCSPFTILWKDYAVLSCPIVSVDKTRLRGAGIDLF